MSEEREFCKTFVIRNPMDPNFSKNKKKYIMNILNSKFVDHCHGGCLIIKIKQIDEISMCEIINSNLSGSGQVNVKFTAYVKSFYNGELICYVQILKTSPFIIGNYRDIIKITSSESSEEEFEVQATVSLQYGVNMGTIPLEKTISSIRESQFVPMRIIQCLHKCLETRVGIVGELIMCDQRYNKYIVTSPITELGMYNIYLILYEIREELTLRSNILENLDENIKNNILYFESLLYSYKYDTKQLSIDKLSIDKLNQIESKHYPIWWGLHPMTIGETNNGEVINLLDYFSKESPNVIGMWSRPLHLFKSSPMAVFEPIPNTSEMASETSGQKYDILEEGKSDVVFITFFKNMLDSLKIIRKMSELYNTDALLKSHQNLWDGMKSVQLFL